MAPRTPSKLQWPLMSASALYSIEARWHLHHWLLDAPCALVLMEQCCSLSSVVEIVAHELRFLQGQG